MGAFSDFFGGVVDAASPPSNNNAATTSNATRAGGVFWDVLGKYTAGGKQAAIDRIAETGTAKKITARVTQDKINSIVSNPFTWLVVGLAVLIVAGVGYQFGKR